MALRIATFNVENLFARFRFRSDVDPAQAVPKGWDVNEQAFKEFTDVDKKITAKAIRELHADVIACQEVENLETLRRFRTRFLTGEHRYPHMIVLDGNDPRLIDVAIMSRHPISHLRSYMDMRAQNGRELFSRDCLEADIELPGGRVITLFVNHLKSMLDKDDPDNGRRNTAARRMEQAKAVRSIVEARFGAQPGDHDWVVLGDLNDYMETDSQGSPSIGDLVEWDQLQNVVDRLPAEERWTHFFTERGPMQPPGYHQLDYVLPSRSLAAQVTKVEIMRKGQPKRAERYPDPHFEGIGRNSPKASDHCPVVMELA